MSKSALHEAAESGDCDAVRHAILSESHDVNEPDGGGVRQLPERERERERGKEGGREQSSEPTYSF
jgi:hypothetical protein